MKFLHWIDKILSAVENTMLVTFLTAMVSLGFFNVIYWNIFHRKIQGGDDFLWHLVLLVAFFGAAQAARQQKHIKIDVLSRLLNESHRNIAYIFINAFSLVITFFLAKAGWDYVMLIRESKEIFGIDIWVYQLVIPLGFILIGYRFFLYFLEALLKTVRRQP